MPEAVSKNTINFGKSSFTAVIGTIYYIWQIEAEGIKADLSETANFLKKTINTSKHRVPDNGKDSKRTETGPVIYFISNSEKSYNYFINFIRDKYLNYPVTERSSPEIEKEIIGYLRGKITEINLHPVYLYGTEFEKKIWEAARKISYGDVASYKELAEKAGYPNAFRAAGTALGNNPLMLVVPCHRVIRSNGEIGYFGGGEEVKLMLLDIEQSQQAH